MESWCFDRMPINKLTWPAMRSRSLVPWEVSLRPLERQKKETDRSQRMVDLSVQWNTPPITLRHTIPLPREQQWSYGICSFFPIAVRETAEGDKSAKHIKLRSDDMCRAEAANAGSSLTGGQHSGGH